MTVFSVDAVVVEVMLVTLAVLDVLEVLVDLAVPVEVPLPLPPVGVGVPKSLATASKNPGFEYNWLMSQIITPPKLENCLE